MARVLGERRHRLRVVCDGEVHVGDRVKISLDESVIVRGALLAYLLPLAGLLLGAVGGQFAGGEAGAFAGGAAGFILAWALARLLASHYFADLQPTARLQ